VEIIEQYKYHPGANSEKVLPFISDKKHNKHVKEIANICGIKKNDHSKTPPHYYHNNCKQ